MIEQSPTSYGPLNDKNSDIQVTHVRFGVAHIGTLESLPTAEKFSQRTLTRSDIQFWCLISVTASTITAATVIALGILIIRHLHPLPQFLKDRCISIDGLKIPYVGPNPQYQLWHFAFPSTASGSLVLLLFVNFVLTVFLVAHDRIGSTSLIWLCHAEDRNTPKYNTNGRFLTGTKAFGPCHWSMNAVAAMSMALCYGAAANMVSRIKVVARCNEDLSVVDRNFSGAHYGMDVSGYALMILGGSLMIQNLLSYWTLVYMFCFRKGILLSWSLDPIVNAIYMIISRNAPSHGTEERETKLTRSSLHQQVLRVRVLIRIVWVTFTLILIAVGIVLYFGIKGRGFTQSEVTRRGGVWSFWGFSWKLIPKGSKTTDWAGPLIQAGMQGLLAAAMHCADIVLGFKNDELSWQEAYMRYAETPNAFVPRKYRLRWLSILLFVVKTVIQWVFSSAISVNVLLTVTMLPLLIVAVLFLFVAVLLEIVSRVDPGDKGAPTAYGEFSKLSAFITRYHLVWL